MSKQWYFQTMGAEIGPISPAEMMDKVKRGLIQPDTLVRNGPDGKWLPADRVKGLLPKPEAPPPPAATVPSPASVSPASAASSDCVPALPTSAASATADDEITYHITGDAAAATQTAEPEPESFEFFEFVGFRHAITPALHSVLVQYASKHGLSITQITRQALAKFLGRPELGEDIKPEPEPAANSDADQDAEEP